MVRDCVACAKTLDGVDVDGVQFCKGCNAAFVKRRDTIGVPIEYGDRGVVGWWRGEGSDGRVHIQHSVGTPLLCGGKRKDIGGFTIVVADLDDSVNSRNRRIRKAFKSGIDARSLAAQYAVPVDEIREIARKPYAPADKDGLTDDERALELERRIRALACAPDFIELARDADLLCDDCGDEWGEVKMGMEAGLRLERIT